MSLIVEDGTGKANAESFISVADATAYHLARGNSAWAALASDTVREQNLRKATDYMEQIYRSMWAGYKRTTSQALCWPRYEVPIKDAVALAYYASDAVPVIVANACAELALRAIRGPLAPDLGQTVKRKKVGPIDIEYADYSTATKRYRAIDQMLLPFLSGTGGMNMKVVRA
jgi:hypothetical protein